MAEDFSRGLIYGPIILRTYLLRTFLFTDLTVFFFLVEKSLGLESLKLFSFSLAQIVFDLLSYSA